MTFKSFRQFWRANPVFWYLLIFLVAFLFLFYFQHNSTFADPDSFYHLKSSLLLRDQGIYEEFPWLYHTVLRSEYTDQHWLYHALMIPFVSWLHPVVGGKVYTVLLGAVLITLFYWLLKKLHVKGAPAFTFLLLLVNPFVFRISLLKAPVFSLIFLLVGIYFIFSYRYKSLFILSFLYVWSYGGFLLILVVTGLYGLISFILTKNPRQYFKNFFKDKDVRLFGWSLAGVILGIIINPYFPQNLKFYWHQLIQIGVINYRDLIGVGGEWYPYGFSELIPNTIFVTLPLVLALVLFLINLKKQKRITITLFILFAFFFLLTLKSRRYVEYYVPFAVLFASVVISRFWLSADFNEGLKLLKDFYRQKKALAYVLLIYLLIVMPYVAIRDIQSNKNSLQNGISSTKFAEAGSWLAQNTPKNSIVMHSDWDEFPILFYQNDHNYYIVGLDPTFMYVYDQDLYWKWVNITIGEQKDNLYQIIKGDFQASYVFLETDHLEMDSNISNDGNFLLVYQDDQAKIYQVL
ncbi:hypothetical protein KKI23_04260 [Patescibacteria group bacterium]|nr:hypothetical protein [Patescibacteria group bacterium]